MICKLLTLALVAAVAGLGYDPDAISQDEGTVAQTGGSATVQHGDPGVTTGR